MDIWTVIKRERIESLTADIHQVDAALADCPREDMAPLMNVKRAHLRHRRRVGRPRDADHGGR
jgi:hypothetical protein